MHAVIAGFLAGAASGVIMGVISHALFKLRVFKSSLIVIDGSFFFRTIGKETGPGLVAAVGLIIHLVTSAVFGAVYFIAALILGFDPPQAANSFSLISLYIFVLYISMLFIALPISGEGLLGRRSGKNSWLEQFVLHVFFFGGYMAFVRILV